LAILNPLSREAGVGLLFTLEYASRRGYHIVRAGIAHGLQERGHAGDVVGVARRRVAGEAGFYVTCLRRRSKSRGCATYPPVDADLEFACIRHAGCHHLSELLSNQKSLPLAEGAGYADRSWNMCESLELYMKGPVPVKSASAFIDEKIKELGDWRGKMLAKVREIIHEADPEIVEEWKWMGTPVWSHGGIVCTGETYKNVVKMTFAKGAALKDPSGLFNSSLDGNVRRAIDIHEGDKVDEAALKDLIRAAVALNLKGKSKPNPRRASSKRAD
jgi:hypothetical protein